MYKIEEGKDLTGRTIFWILKGADLVHSEYTREAAQNWINNQK